MAKLKMKPSRTVQKSTKASRFPIVGIGASAGGLEAFMKLLRYLSPTSGMAYVVIQHLSPKYKSFLSEILSNATPLRVIEVKDGVRIEPNCVYVIPPSVSMEIKDGVLHLIRREDFDRTHLVIDFFFRSLAKDQKNDAIGVILSGTGSDGAEGLKAIKSEGGIAFAQEPDSAKYGGMPRRAISVDHVDFILTPENIAKELNKISKHPYLKEPFVITKEEDQSPEVNDQVNKVLRLVKQSTGVDFSQYKRTTVRRRIMRRMAVHKVELLADYYSILKDNHTEQAALQNDILINVTSFFRDPEVFEKMKKSVFPALLNKRQSHDPIRIWVPSCATGEEAYSIAIVLLEYLEDKCIQHSIQVFASDLSESCITKARAGKYVESISENVSEARLKRFFIKSDKGFVVCKEVRDLCVFAKHDVINDPPYSKLDLISCRNLLIYLEPVLQRKTLGVFNYALNPTGFLILGHSETPSSASRFFSPFEKKEKIYKVNPNSAQTRPMFATPHPTEEFFSRETKLSRSSLSLDAFERDTDHLIATRYSPPSVVINENLEVIQFRGDTSFFLLNQTGRASFQILKMAREGMAPQLKSLIETAKKGASAKCEDLKIRREGVLRSVSLEVVPLRLFSTNRFFLIFFRELGSYTSAFDEHSKKISRASKATKRIDPRIVELTQELAESKAYLESLNRDLESTNQDLQSANEEVLSANEELQSTNEELETAKEELQSANEELTTVNDELQNRNIELDQLSNDLINILGSIEIPILMVGKDGKIRRVTPAAQKALNLQNSDVGRPIREVKSYFDVLGLELDLEQKVAEVVETMTATETEIQDGKSRWFRLQVRPYRTLDNRIDGVVVALIDIDALKRSLAEVGLARSEAEKARQSAEAGNRTKDLFLATLSHELRTPLTTILTYSQLLRLGKLSSEDIKKSMLMIEQSAQAQAQLINDLLDVSRIMMGKLALELQKINPATVLHDTIESLRPLAERKSIQIVEKISDQNLFICGDLTRLKQIFLNLLTNAVKFSKNDDVIEIYLDYLNEGERDIVCIRVKDFGKGVSEKFLPFLFDRFSQADSSSTRNHGGMGLGLAIVRSLAEAHGGSVHAESPGEGKGATFTVKLPLSSRESSAQIIEAHSNFPTSLNSLGKMTKHQEIPRLDGLRILFVDDDPSARESLGTLLKSLGAIVILVESVRAAIEELPLFRPDILISDLAIPDENGYSLIKKVRRFLNEEFRSLPALALTAFAGVEDAKRAIDAGFDAHLAKPVDSYEFAKAILNVIQSE